MSNPKGICTDCKNLDINHHIENGKMVLYCRLGMWWPKEICKRKVTLDENGIRDQIAYFRKTIKAIKTLRGNF